MLSLVHDWQTVAYWLMYDIDHHPLLGAHQITSLSLPYTSVIKHTYVLFCQWCMFYCTVFNLHAAFEGQWANSCLDRSLCKQVMKLLSYMLLWMVLVRDCHCWSYCRYVYFLLLLKVLVRDCHCCSYCRCVFSIFLFLICAFCVLSSKFWKSLSGGLSLT